MSQNPKTEMRTEAKRIRAGAHQMYALEAAEAAAKHGLQMLSSFEKHAIIALYWPIGDELDPRFLLNSLERAGYRTALPVVIEKDAPLSFQLWGSGDPLDQGPFNTLHPTDDAPTVIPNVVIAPLLAFDADCYRLGYGGGFYDRTLAVHTEIKAFGYAFAAQFTDGLPHDTHDWPLQGVITEQGVILPSKLSA